MVSKLRQRHTSVTFIDLKKAFDTVNHEILLKKVYLYGIKDNEFCWFRSYLSHRKQCCKVVGQISTHEDITCGVPKGSCLGPLLFLLCINDLHLSLNHSEGNMYADDTSISFSSNYFDLLCVKTWMESNKLSLNVTKTQTILIGGRKKLKGIENFDPQNLQTIIDQEPVSKIKHIRYLGIEVDQFRSWEEHISVLIKQISSGIGMLRHGKRYFPLTTVQSMYRSIIEPHFRCCCSVWGVCNATALNKLQKLQNHRNYKPRC